MPDGLLFDTCFHWCYLRMDVDHEIELLKTEIKRLGTEQNGNYVVKFGVLFKWVSLYSTLGINDTIFHKTYSHVSIINFDS